MKKKITFTLVALLITGFIVNAQSSYVNKVIVVNEGHFDYITQTQTIPVTVGAYDPASRIYTAFDTIRNARFATNVLVDGSSIYVAADSFLIRYNANSYRRLQTTVVRGIRKMAIWNNELLITRGEYLETFDSYFQAYDKNNLHFLYDLSVTAGPQYASEGIIVKGNTAFVAINNGFDFGNEVGLVGRVDLANHKYLGEINLGVLGKNPEAIYNNNDNIYTVNNTDYSTSSISNINVSTLSVNTINLKTTTGCGASGFMPGFIMFQVLGESQVGCFNTVTLSMQDTLKINRNIYGMATDTLNKLIYVGETDYLSSGSIYIYDMKGGLKGSFNVSVSPGNIALDVRTGKNNNGKRLEDESASSMPALTCYPNPAHDDATILTSNSGNATDTYILTDITGREVNKYTTAASSFTIDMNSFEPGIYMLRSNADAANYIKIVKQ